MNDVFDNSRFDNCRLNSLDYVEKTSKDIINDANFKTEEQELICQDIISHLERTAVEEINKGNCVQIPFIGCLRKNPLKKTLDENRTKFKAMAKHLSKEDFKEYTAETFREKKKELKRIDYIKFKTKELRNKNKAKYEQYCKVLGPAYANMFIKSIMMMDAVEFNQEFEDRLQELNKYE